MGSCVKILLFSFVASAIYLAITINSILQIPPIPELKDEWWGPGLPIKQNTAIEPFKINVSDEIIKDLKDRLNNARPFTKPLEGVQQQYGMNTNLLTEIVEFWKTKYNWREREKFLNKFHQFTTSVQGLQIHFLHVKPSVTNGLRVLPLLILHGWPGSIREFYEIIPLLTTPRKGKDFVFEVIAPSLPGFGFSKGSSKTGLGTVQMAVIFKNLMRRLGFAKYYIQGGDWGSLIVSNMATLFPDDVLGVHSNACLSDSPATILKLVLGSIYPPFIVDKKFEHKLYPLSSLFSHLMVEFGYMHLHSTKPDTIGVGLNDSPVGLAAYILEKFTSWTKYEWINRSDGGLKLKFTYTDLLDNVMIYWITNSITTSVRLYSEEFSEAHMSLRMGSIPIKIPSACANFHNEIIYQPESLSKDRYRNMLHFSEIPDGGHFAAFEVPDLLAAEIWTTVDKFEHFYKGK